MVRFCVLSYIVAVRLFGFYAKVSWQKISFTSVLIWTPRIEEVTFLEKVFVKKL